MDKKEEKRIRTALAEYAASIVFRKDGTITATRYGCDGPYSEALEREIKALPATTVTHHIHEIARDRYRRDITFRPDNPYDCTIVSPEERIALARTRVTIEGRSAAVIDIAEDVPTVVTLWGFPRLRLTCLWQEVRHVIQHEGGRFSIPRRIL